MTPLESNRNIHTTIHYERSAIFMLPYNHEIAMKTQIDLEIL